MAGDEGVETSAVTSDLPGFSASSSASRSVFLSYASHDAETANTVCQYLENHGVSCWLAPRNVRPGTEYADSIVAAINEAKAVVLVLSGSAVASSHVGREVERAASKHKQIIAFRIDTAPMSRSFEYFLSNSQWIDVPALGMPAALAKLLAAVGKGAAQAEVSDADFPGRRKRRRIAVVAAAGLGAGIAAISGVYFLAHKAPQPATTVAVADKSIAVLPFVDMSEKKDQEYFADGMAEEILDLLTKIPGLAVIGRTSSFQFKGKNEDLRSIGAKLNAAYILEGSVRKFGDQVRITAQLINTRTGTHEWSETYDRRIDDVLKLQDAIAATVVRELQLTVASGDLQPRSSVKNADAYDLILRGRHAANRFDKQGLDEAVTLLKQAIDRDATLDDAAAQLAFTYYYQGANGFLAPAEAFEQARRAAATALKLDPKNALTHYVLGKIYIVYDWDWAAAKREFQQVATLAPGSAEALNGEARLSLALGRWEDALRQVNAALALDPLDPNSFEALGTIQWGRGHLPDAEAAMRRTLDIRPTYAWGHYYLGRVLLARGDRDAALLEMQQETVDEGQQGGLGMVYYALGRKADSDSALARMVKEHADGYAFYIAEVYAFRGQSDEALHWLERAYAQKDPYLIYVKVELPLGNLENDPRYKAFLKKMNLPE